MTRVVLVLTIFASVLRRGLGPLVVMSEGQPLISEVPVRPGQERVGFRLQAARKSPERPVPRDAGLPSKVYISSHLCCAKRGDAVGSSTCPLVSRSLSAKATASRPKEITIREEAPENLRYCVLETARELGWNPSVLRDVVCRVLREVPDTNNWSEYPNIWREVHDLTCRCDWYKVYDIIEALHANFAEYDAVSDTQQQVAPRLADAINSFFIEKGIGWHLVNGQIVTRGNEVFESTMRTAATVLRKNEKPTAAGHLEFATAALSARPKANTSGAVAQATNAIECVLGEITGEPMTLGEYLN